MFALVKAVVVAVLTAAAAAAFADEAIPAPVMKVGDQWKLTRTYVNQPSRQPLIYTNEVTAVQGDEAVVLQTNSTGARFVWVYQNGRAHWLRRFAYDEAAPDKRGRVLYDGAGDEPAVPFPLAVGKTSRYKQSWTNARGNAGYDEGPLKVSAKETIKTPAGDFDTYRVEFDGKYVNSVSRDTDVVTFKLWYAPAAKRYVRMEYENWYQGRISTHYVDELTSMSLAP